MRKFTVLVLVLLVALPAFGIVVKSLPVAFSKVSGPDSHGWTLYVSANPGYGNGALYWSSETIDEFGRSTYTLLYAGSAEVTKLSRIVELLKGLLNVLS